jgi:hypothetical protein
METAAIMEGGVAYWLGVEERADERAQLAVTAGGKQRDALAALAGGLRP